MQTNLHTNISDVAPGKTFTSFEEFKEYAETPISVDRDGRRVDIYDEKTGEIIRHYEERDKDLWCDTFLTDSAGNNHPFTWRNMDASLFDYNEDLSRITVYSRADQIAYNHYVETRTTLFLLAYIAIISTVVIVYLKKRIRIGRLLADVP